MFGFNPKARNCRTAGALMALAAGIFQPDAAQAQRAQTFDQVTINNSALPALGKVVFAGSASELRIDAGTGALSRVSGNAVLVGNVSSASVPTITITCDRSILSSAVCAKGTVMTVTISSTSNARARISSFNISAVSGSPVTWGPTTTSGNQLSFTVTFTDAKNTVASFKLGATVVLTATGATGQVALPYTVTISRP